MVTEDYVSFETAKLLKEKGFPQSAFKCHYIITGDGYYKSFEDRCGFGDYDIIAPTLAMAMKWLREVHNLIILVEVERVKYGNVRYNWNIIDDNSDYSVTVRAKYPTYEGACEAGIKHCLENLIWI